MKPKWKRDKIDLGILKVFNYFMIATVIACGVMLLILKLCEWKVI